MDRNDTIRAIQQHATTLRYPADPPDKAMFDDMKHFFGRTISTWDDLTDEELVRAEARLDQSAAPHR
jgi:hypothetical protein